MLGIVVLLLNKDRISARQLAERFEVSVRTIYRDIEAINCAGIPVVAYSGINGGFGIMENYKLDRHVLTLHEMVSIVTALKGVNATFDNGEFNSVIEKIVNLVPHDKTSHFLEKHEEFVIDILPWGVKAKLKDDLKIIQQSIAERKVLRFVYRNSKGKIKVRDVEPMTLVFKGYAWYLYAFCRLKKDFRIFKLTRMGEIKIFNELFVKRLETYSNFMKRSADKTSFVDLVLKFSPEAKIKVEESFDESSITLLDDGYLEVRISLPEDEWLYSMILGFGEYVEVLQPGYIRKKIIERAEKIFSVYKHDIMES